VSSPGQKEGQEGETEGPQQPFGLAAFNSW